MDAPERIWAVHLDTNGAVINGAWADTIRHFGGGVEYIRADRIEALEPVTVQDAARVLLDNLNEASDLDDLIQASMQKEADTGGTEEWVFVLRAGLRAMAERGG